MYAIFQVSSINGSTFCHLEQRNEQNVPNFYTIFGGPVCHLKQVLALTSKCSDFGLCSVNYYSARVNLGSKKDFRRMHPSEIGFDPIYECKWFNLSVTGCEDICETVIASWVVSARPILRSFRLITQSKPHFEPISRFLGN